MRKQHVYIFLVLVICFGFISCIKQAPQLPSNKGIVKDKTPDSLLKMNHGLTIREDSLLKIFANKKGSFQKNQVGFWYTVFKTGKGASIKDSVQCSYYFEIKKLSGEILQSGKNQIIIGKKQTIVGLEEGLKLMHKGDSATFIIPWYLAYGMTGNKPLIPPYTSLIYNVKLLN
jgi:FKBP-type peptidyl-prolyl cis-trans isomerase